MIRKVLPFVVVLVLLVSCCTSHKSESEPVVEPAMQIPDITDEMLLLFDAMPDDEAEMNLVDPMEYYWDIALNSIEFEKASVRWRSFSGKEESFIVNVASRFPFDLEPSYSVVFELCPEDSEKVNAGDAMISYYHKNYAAFVEDYISWKGYGLALADYIQALAAEA